MTVSLPYLVKDKATPLFVIPLTSAACFVTIQRPPALGPERGVMESLQPLQQEKATSKRPVPRSGIAALGQNPAMPYPMPKITEPPINRRSMTIEGGTRKQSLNVGFERCKTLRYPKKVTATPPANTKASIGSHVTAISKSSKL